MGKNRNKKASSQSLQSKQQEIDLTKPKFSPADLFDRALAYGIDCVILLIPIGWITMATWLKDPEDILTNPAALSTSPFWLNTVIFGIFALYFVLLAWLNKGQTLGQMIMRLKTVPEEITKNKKKVNEIDPLSFKQALLYGIGKAPPLIILFDLLIGWFIAKKERKIQQPMRAFQIWGECIVIKLEKREKKQYEIIKPLK
jgi:hypothetical protein